MAAGLGFKDFTTGEVLTAGDVDGYLMQGIWVFASAAARDAAVTSPQEGNFAYLKDTNVTTYYTGSAWANLDTTGMTNPMTTTGDTIYSSSGSTPARLGIGTAGQVLTVNSGATAPEWKTPAGGGGKVLQVVSATTSTSSTTTSESFTDNNLSASITPSATSSKILVLVTQNYTFIRSGNEAGGGLQLVRGSTVIFNTSSNKLQLYKHIPGSTSIEFYDQTAITYLDSPNTTSSTTYKMQHAVAYSSSSGSFSSQAQTASTITLLEIGA
jgi:hypothetical protein